MEYEVTRSITGKWQVHYECPSCGESLVNELADAGQKDTCPNCATGFVVPGQQERQRVAREEREAIRQRELAAAKKQLEREEKEATQAVERALTEVDELERQRVATKHERVRLSSEILARSHGPIDLIVRVLETTLSALVVLCLLSGSIGLVLVLVRIVTGIKTGYSFMAFSFPMFLFAFSIICLVLLGAAAAILRIERSTRAAAMAVVEIADLLTMDRETEP